MNTYRAKIKLQSGSMTEVEINAQTAAIAKEMLEAQYGVGSVYTILQK